MSNSLLTESLWSVYLLWWHTVYGFKFRGSLQWGDCLQDRWQIDWQGMWSPNGNVEIASVSSRRVSVSCRILVSYTEYQLLPDTASIGRVVILNTCADGLTLVQAFKHYNTASLWSTYSFPPSIVPLQCFWHDSVTLITTLLLTHSHSIGPADRQYKHQYRPSQAC